MQFFNAGVTITVRYLCNSEELKQDNEKPFFWSTEKRLNYNHKNFRLIFFSKKRSQIQASLPGTKRYITRKSLQRYIKIFSVKLLWDLNLDAVFAKRNKNLFYLRKSIPITINSIFKCNLLKCYILSVLLYGMNV